MSRATARSDRLAPSLARWRRAIRLDLLDHLGPDRARMEAAGM